MGAHAEHGGAAAALKGMPRGTCRYVGESARQALSLPFSSLAELDPKAVRAGMAPNLLLHQPAAAHPTAMQVAGSPHDALPAGAEGPAHAPEEQIPPVVDRASLPAAAVSSALPAVVEGLPPAHTGASSAPTTVRPQTEALCLTLGDAEATVGKVVECRADEAAHGYSSFSSISRSAARLGAAAADADTHRVVVCAEMTPRSQAMIGDSE